MVVVTMEMTWWAALYGTLRALPMSRSWCYHTKLAHITP